MFKVDNKETRTIHDVVLVSLLLTFNIFNVNFEHVIASRLILNQGMYH